MLQATGINNEGETVTCATKVFERRLKVLQEKREKERHQQVLTESWERTRWISEHERPLSNKRRTSQSVPKWKKIFRYSNSPTCNSDSMSPKKDGPQQLTRNSTTQLHETSSGQSNSGCAQPNIEEGVFDLQEETELEIVEVLHRNMGGQRRNKTHRCRSSNKKGMKKEEASVQGLTKQEHTKTTVPTMVAKVRSWDRFHHHLREAAQSEMPLVPLQYEHCRGIISYTSYSRTNDCIYNGYDNINLEHNAMNNKNTITHMDAHNTQY